MYTPKSQVTLAYKDIVHRDWHVPGFIILINKSVIWKFDSSDIFVRQEVVWRYFIWTTIYFDNIQKILKKKLKLNVAFLESVNHLLGWPYLNLTVLRPLFELCDIPLQMQSRAVDSAPVTAVRARRAARPRACGGARAAAGARRPAGRAPVSRRLTTA